MRENAEAMVKSDLAALLAQKHRWLRGGDAKLAIDAILESLAESLANNRRIEIRGFGAFYVRKLPSRLGRNPKTGEQVGVPSKKVVRFKAIGQLAKMPTDETSSSELSA